MGAQTRTRGRSGNQEWETRGEKSQGLIVTSSANISFHIPSNKILAIFAMGGGGSADNSQAGASGFFKYVEDVPCHGSVVLGVTIGEGGKRSGDSGDPSSVVLMDEWSCLLLEEGVEVLGSVAGLEWLDPLQTVVVEATESLVPERDSRPCAQGWVSLLEVQVCLQVTVLEGEGSSSVETSQTGFMM